MRLAAAYLRMSTDKQEYSIDSQLRLIKDYAKNNNISIEKIYSDEGISGRLAEKRPAFLQMIDDSLNHTFDCVLIYDSSRFARNLEQSILYKAELKKNGVELISITEPTLDEDTSIMTDAILGAMNEMYSRKLSKNVKRGMEQKAMRGEYLSCAPFGYDRIFSGKALQINVDEAKIITFIFNRFLENQSTFRLAKELNSMGIKTKRNNPIDNRWVINVLTNPVYKGFLKWRADDRTIYKKADHLPIIDEAFFDFIQEKYFNSITKKRHVRPADSHRHWMIGFIRCFACNSVFVYAKGYKGRSDRFRCGGYTNAKCEIPSSIKVSDFEKLFFDKLRMFVGDDLKLYSLNISQLSPVDISSIEKEIQKQKKNIQRAKEAYLAGIDSLNEYKDNKFNSIVEIERLEKMKDELTTENNEKYMLNIIKVLNENTDILVKSNSAKTILDKIIFDSRNKLISVYFFA